MIEKEENFKKELSFKRFFIKYMIKSIISICISLIVFLIVFFIRGNNFTGILDGLFLASVASITMGLFSLITNLGFFDLIAYNGARFNNFIHQYKGKSFNGVFEYSESKKEKRKENRYVFLSYLVVGIVFLIISIIYLFVFRK